MATNRKTKTTTSRSIPKASTSASGFAAKPPDSDTSAESEEPVTQSETVKSEAVKATKVKPEAAKPEAAKPEAAKPEAAKPEVAKPEVSPAAKFEAKALSPEPVVTKPPAAEVKVTEPKPAKAAAKKSSVPAASTNPSLSIWNRPTMTSELEIAGVIVSAGERPVSVSHMELFGTILNGRPIESSHLVVADMTGSSPIFVSDFKAVEGMYLPGGRPVMASNASVLPGGRPIADNDVDDADMLMGFLD
jgi:hypothetical protein